MLNSRFHPPAALLFLLLPLAVACSGGPASAGDLSTDEGVRAAYAKQTGEKLDERHGCTGRTGVKDVVVVGSFASDRGCILTGAFVAGRFITGDRLPTEGLAGAGWDTVAAADRPAFALQWAEKVLFHWGGDFVASSDKAFDFDDTPPFAPPAAVAEGDVVVVTAWVEEPPGMMDQDAFVLVELRFSSAGAVTRATKAQFAVAGERLR